MPATRANSQDVESQIARAVDLLRDRLGPTVWSRLHKHTRSCLVTSQILYDILKAIHLDREDRERAEGSAGEAPEIDFSPIILSLFKSIEIEIEHNILRPFRDSVWGQGPVNLAAMESSPLAEFVRYLNKQNRPPSLGVVALLLSQLGSANQDDGGVLRALKLWMKRQFAEPERWWRPHGLGVRINSGALKDRNDAAHTQRFTPLQAWQSYDRLWGKPGSEGLLPALYRALERKPAAGETIGKYTLAKPLLLKPRHWLLEAADELGARRCLLSLIPGGLEDPKSFSTQFRKYVETSAPGLLGLDEWFPAPDPFAGRIAIVSDLRGASVMDDEGRWPPLPEEECRGLAIALARALSVLHDGGLVHGFLSPHVLFRERDGSWLVAGQALGLAARNGLSVYGYPRTVSPEFGDLNVRSLSPAVDVFAIAATVCCMRERTPVRNAAAPTPADPGTLFSDERLRTALSRALSPDPRQRQASASELLAGVEGLPLLQAATFKAKSEARSKMEKREFDVFLCHNSADKEEVKRIAERLMERGIAVWLDEWHSPPGQRWQKHLEKQIGAIRAAAVFVGRNGIGLWQDMEVEALLRKVVSKKRPVVPVILPDAKRKPRLPVFLESLSWVDFRKQNPDPIERLVFGITGRNPVVF